MPAPRPKKREGKRLGNEDGFFSGLPARHRFTKVSKRVVNMLIRKQDGQDPPQHLRDVGRQVNPKRNVSR